MKRIANRLILFAAATLSLGTVAYGQNTLKADVPFVFRMPGGLSSAGHYTVRLETNGTGKIVHVEQRETGRSALSIAYRLDSKLGANVTPHLVFRCAAAGCQLSEIWTVFGGVGIPVSHVREPEYVASIPLAVSRN
jgi:hypothetical protein